MYDNLMTATEVRKFYGAGALHLLQTMRVGHLVGPDRTEPNGHGGMTQLFSKNRVQQAAVFMVKAVPAPEYCSQAFFCGLLGVSRKELLPEQELYFQAGAAIKARLEKPPTPKKAKAKCVNQLVTSARSRIKAKNLLDWSCLR
jgi:hypothetical protein